MEHAEYIAEAVSCTKQAFSHINGIITWIKLFLAIIVPMIAGVGIATAVLQIIVKPILFNLLITPNLGFTEGGITYILQYMAVIIGLLFVFFFPFYQGYLSRCMQVCGLPDVGNGWGLFFAGWRVNALLLYYAIPLLVIFLIYAFLFTMVNDALDVVLTGDLAGIAALFDYVSLTVYLILEFVTCIFLMLFAFIGLVHLARTSSLKEAVNIGKIADLIRTIGWYNYILCIVIVAILLLAILIFFVGIASLFSYALVSNIILFGLFIFVMIPFGIFVTHYLSNVYDTAFIEPEEDTEDFDDF